MPIKKGARVKILDAHDKKHKFGTVEIVSSETPYGVIIDGMEDMGVHKWYVDSEIEVVDDRDQGEGKKKPMKMGGAFVDAYSIAASRPWAIVPDALETILSIAARTHDGDIQALVTKLGRPVDNTRTVRNVDGVAVIPVVGPIFRYANIFTEISGATSTQVLATDIRAALDNTFLTGIVLNMDTPGGDANGINELAKMIYEGRKKKPIVAYAGGMMASGGLWIGSAASEIVADETAIVGSLGVVMGYNDTSKRDEKADVRRVEIVSSNAPDKRLDPNTDAGRAKVQAMVDALESVFISSVAKYRGRTEAHVVANFGRGGILVGNDAKRVGMVDRIGTLESVIASLAGGPR